MTSVPKIIPFQLGIWNNGDINSYTALFFFIFSPIFFVTLLDSLILTSMR